MANASKYLWMSHITRAYKFTNFRELKMLGKRYEKEKAIDRKYKPPANKNTPPDASQKSTHLGRNKIAALTSKEPNDSDKKTNGEKHDNEIAAVKSDKSFKQNQNNNDSVQAMYANVYNKQQKNNVSRQVSDNWTVQTHPSVPGQIAMMQQRPPLRPFMQPYAAMTGVARRAGPVLTLQAYASRISS